MEEILTHSEELYYMEYIISQLMSLAVTIFTLVCSWKIYSKAGEHGWACLIPFYNEYINFKVAKKKVLFIPYLIATILFSIAISVLLVCAIGAMFMAIAPNRPDLDAMLITMAISGIISLLLMVALLVINIIHSIALAKAFNQGIAFAIGLIFVPIVFRAILAFSNNIQYNFNNNPYNLNNMPQQFPEYPQNNYY